MIRDGLKRRTVNSIGTRHADHCAGPRSISVAFIANGRKFAYGDEAENLLFMRSMINYLESNHGTRQLLGNGPGCDFRSAAGTLRRTLQRTWPGVFPRERV